MNDKYQKLDAEKLEQVAGGAGMGARRVGVQQQIRTGEMGTAFIGGSKFSVFSTWTQEQIQALTPDDPYYALAQEYFAFLEHRAKLTNG